MADVLPPLPWDPYRLPTIRHATNMLIRKTDGGFDRVEVKEAKASVLLIVDKDNDGIGVRTVTMSLPEATRLAEILNRIRRRVVDRKDWET